MKPGVFPPGDILHEDCSRWKMFIEVRDALVAVLAPALSLGHLLRHGRRIQQALAQKNVGRPGQLTRLKILLSR